MHQVTSITNSQGTSSFQYNLAGNLVAETDPLGRVTSRTYNARGQETSVTLPDPDGAGPLTAPVFTKAFNARGELVSQTDAMGNSTSWTYNAQGQALTQSDPDPDGVGPLPAAVTTFTYDLRGLRSSVTDASGNTTSYGYDHAGRLVQEIDPRGNSSYYQYDAAGQVTRVVDRNSRKRDFSYNDLGLVTSEVWIDGFGNAVKTIAHGYDDAGRETSISDGLTGYNYQYDLADRVTYTDNAGSVDMPQVQLNSHYDFEGNRTWLSDSQGGSVWYAWNNQRLQSMAMSTEAGKYAGVGFTYDQVGRLSSLTRTTNGNYYTTINTSYTLDFLDRVTSITHSKVMGEDASLLSQFTYGYDASGRVTNYTGPEGSLSYALDTNGQLLSVTGSRTDNYSFDANGNRTSNSTAAGNLLLNDGQYSYTYDLEGNQKTKTRISDGQVTEFFWDYRNQLTKAMVKDANGVLLKELRFTYDVEGRRVGSWVDADGAGPEEPDQVWTVFDGVNPYMDFDGEGELQTRYLYSPGIDELFARIGSGEDPEWYLTDRLGSVRQIVDASGAVLDEISYDSFGGILIESNPSQGDRFKFTGREYSPELGIYYYRARWYDPSAGRFISQDPIGFSAGDVNLYRYVGNAPGDATDPSGLVNWWNPFSWTTNELAAFSEGTQDGVLMIYNAATFHQDTQVNAYVNNIIQQNGGTYGFANGSAHVGAYAAYAGVFVWGWGAVGMPTFNVGFQFNGVIPHFIYGTTSNGVTTWAHASGIPGWLYIQVAGPTVVESSFTLMGVPILSAATALPAAYLTTNPDARTCLTAALDAWFHGTVGFRR